MDVFAKYTHLLDANTIMVGHSLGPAFVLRILEKTNKIIKSAFFVAPFIEPLGNTTFDALNKTFIDKPFDWEKIKNQCNKFYIYSSDNDSYVPLEQGEKLTKKLDAVFRVVKGAGHFNEAAGYTKFEVLLNDLLKELSLVE